MTAKEDLILWASLFPAIFSYYYLVVGSTCTSVHFLLLPSNFVNRFCEKLTAPAIFAWIVQSFPVYVFLPGRYFVPFWRIIMPPGFTFSPPKSFKPKRLLRLSRLFEVDPPAFLCAMRVMVRRCLCVCNEKTRNSRQIALVLLWYRFIFLSSCFEFH